MRRREIEVSLPQSRRVFTAKTCEKKYSQSGEGEEGGRVRELLKRETGVSVEFRNSSSSKSSRRNMNSSGTQHLFTLSASPKCGKPRPGEILNFPPSFFHTRFWRMSCPSLGLAGEKLLWVRFSRYFPFLRFCF